VLPQRARLLIITVIVSDQPEPEVGMPVSPAIRAEALMLALGKPRPVYEYYSVYDRRRLRSEFVQDVGELADCRLVAQAFDRVALQQVGDVLIELGLLVEKAQAWIVPPRPAFYRESDVHEFDPVPLVLQMQPEIVPDAIGVHADLY
jgi:hypothetical protein